MVKGQQIMVRSTFDQPILRRFWAESDGMVVICRDEIFKDLVPGDEPSKCITISKGDAFVFESTLFKQMKKYDDLVDSFPKELERLWEKATPLFPEYAATGKLSVTI